jgi:cyanate permease
MRSFGEFYGYFFAIFMLGAGLGPLVMGVSFDRTGAYNSTLVCFELSLVFASILVVRLGPYAYPVSHGAVPRHEEPIAGLTAPHRP